MDLPKNEYGWWYLEDGMVTFCEYGTVKGKTGWWHIKESQADLTYTGFASNENGDWVCREWSGNLCQRQHRVWNRKRKKAGGILKEVRWSMIRHWLRMEMAGGM